jgi:hypothetical protein
LGEGICGHARGLDAGGDEQLVTDRHDVGGAEADIQREQARGDDAVLTRDRVHLRDHARAHGGGAVD